MGLYAILAVIMAALGGFLFGYNTGVIAGALLFIKEQFHLNATMQGWAVSVLLLGALIAAMMSGAIADRFGRKRALLLSAFLFVIGCFLAAKAPDEGVFLWGRFITGLGVGLVSVVVPMYLSEISSSKSRGAIVAVYQLAITMGVLTSFGANYLLASEGEWRLMIAWGAAPALLQLLFFPLLPESPRWFIAKGNEVKAHQALRKLKLSETLEEHKSTEKKSTWSAIFKTPSLRRAVFVGLLLSCFQQITGINAVIYFAPQIFEFVGLPSRDIAILASVGIGTVNVLVTILSVWLIDRVGRRILLMVSLLGMAISLACISVTFYSQSEELGLISLFGLMGYVGFFAIGLGPVTWVIISEIYSLPVRAKAMSLATFANWLFNYIVAFTFLNIVHQIGTGSTFLIFIGLSILAFFFVLKFVPETKGKKLGEIQKLF